MSSVAFAVSCASSLTSLATTAKPLPASPARAASMVALSASRLVCSAMLVITLTTLPISAEDSPSLATVAVVVSAAIDGAGRDLAGLGRVRRDLPDRGTHLLGTRGHGGTLRETSSAAPATTPDWLLVSCAEAAICADDADSSSDDAATASADEATPLSTARRFAWAASSAAGHAAELVGGPHVGDHGEVAGGHGLGRPLDRAHGPRDPADDEQREHARDDHRGRGGGEEQRDRRLRPRRRPGRCERPPAPTGRRPRPRGRPR